MSAFPLKFVAWKTRMMVNAARSRREYLAFALAGGLMAFSGAAALSVGLGRALVDASAAGPDALERALDVWCLSLYLVLGFMALANVITRFFGDARLAEREHLMGPIPPLVLFCTEILDALRLPLVALVAVGALPLLYGGLTAGVPLWLLLLTLAVGLVVFVQPTLWVVAGSIAVVRLVPRAMLGRQSLLFGVMLAACVMLLMGLGTVRGLLSGASIDGLSVSPSHLVATLVPSWQRGEGLLQPALLALASTALATALAAVLYKGWFLGDLDRFRMTTAPGGGGGDRGLLQRALTRLFGAPVAALVVKDLRSSRRDTAQRVAFTLMVALVSALVLRDLMVGSSISPLFLPLFFVYALFLVSTQGLSTFSAEGGVLENLARLPLSASTLLLGKVLSHLVIFMSVNLAAVLLLAVAPLGLPWYFQLPLAALAAVVLVPLGAVLALLTVTLGAIFPKPGEGGAQKEISIFAMGLFLHLATLLGVSLLAGGAALLLGPAYVGVLVAVVLAWAGVFVLLWRFARMAVARAMGSELRG